MLRTTRLVLSRPFVITFICTWLAIAVAAVVYLNLHPGDTWLLYAALPACLLESGFYLGATFSETREALEEIFPPPRRALILWLSGLAPYLVFSLAAQTFRPPAFLLLAVLVALLSFWYLLVPRRAAYDIGFLAIAAAPIITHVFRRVYIAPDPKIQLDILGHLMWIRVGIGALLSLRPWDPGKFGLWPLRKEWRSGLGWYAITLVPVCAIALGLHDVRLAVPSREVPIVVAQGIGTFFGILWVVALSEELFFRGFIAQGLLKSGVSPFVAVAISALLFGSSHLWFHQFPNWPRAAVATVLGLGCGAAYVQTRSVRVSMVTHALVVTTWRLFFRDVH